MTLWSPVYRRVYMSVYSGAGPISEPVVECSRCRPVLCCRCTRYGTPWQTCCWPAQERFAYSTFPCCFGQPQPGVTTEQWVDCLLLPMIVMLHPWMSVRIAFFVCHCLVCACMLYYCNMVRWAWWDWELSGIWITNHPPSVLWHCWLGQFWAVETSSPKWPKLCRVGRKPCSTNLPDLSESQLWMKNPLLQFCETKTCSCLPATPRWQPLCST